MLSTKFGEDLCFLEIAPEVCKAGCAHAQHFLISIDIDKFNAMQYLCQL